MMIRITRIIFFINLFSKNKTYFSETFEFVLLKY